MPEPNFRFDDQADIYDERAGLGPSVGRTVAAAVVGAVGLRPGERIAEIGAGTGAIGLHLTELAAGYIGLDLSRPMLVRFRRESAQPPALVETDCNQTWPLATAATAAVFASRVVHLLDAAAVVREVLRVCRPGGRFVVGRVNRDEDGIKERLRRQRQILLRQAGVAPRDGAEGTRRFVEQCIAAGGTSLGRRTVAAWQGIVSPAEVLAGWAPLSRMGSITLDLPRRAAILDALRGWAQQEYGDLDRPRPFGERYTIEVVRLP
ncbi:MAG: class I SAM-dependent methyltransferase [Dehalococcoidia bacterium]